MGFLASLPIARRETSPTAASIAAAYPIFAAVTTV